MALAAPRRERDRDVRQAYQRPGGQADQFSATARAERNGDKQDKRGVEGG